MAPMAMNLGDDGTCSDSKIYSTLSYVQTKPHLLCVMEDPEYQAVFEGSMIERICDLDSLFHGLISVCLRQMLSISKGNLR